MPTLGWEPQTPAKDSEKDEQPPQKGKDQEEKSQTGADASAKNSETPAKAEERLQEPSKVPFEGGRLNFPSPQFEPDKKESTTFNFPTISERSMPHRVDPYPMTSSHHRRYDYDRRPTPPPITTLTHSPSTSVSSLADRSAVSTPPMRRSPPHNMPPHMYPAPYPPDPMLSRAAHFRPEHLPHAYMYAPPPPHPIDHRPYEHHDGPQTAYHPAPMPGHMVPPMHARAEQHYAPYPSQQGAPIFTDDAATKLSERVRRRCFNCCTTDTSTWRRSNLSPGKVLCNKCGLFERTHSRPRPEQFPHKRGPLSSSTLRARTPPQNQLPPLSPPQNFHYPSHHYPPHPRDFPSPPTTNTAALPSLQNWPPPPPHDSAPSPKPARRPTLDSNGAADPSGPPSTSGSRGPTPPASRPASASTQEHASASAAAAA